MADIPYFMNYVVFFQDPLEYQTAVATAGGTNFLAIPPRAAATMFGIPFPYPSGDLNTIPKGIYFIFPYTPGAQYFFPGPTGIFVDDTLNNISVPSTVGSSTGVFNWSGNIILNGGAVTEEEPAPVAIAQRRWVFGRELLSNYEQNSVSIESDIIADSSRVLGGYGLKISNATSNNVLNNSLNTFRTGLVTNQSWERLYIRIRKLPVFTPPPSMVAIWGGQSTGGTGGDIGIGINASGELRYFETALSTDQGLITTLQLGIWYRIDILLRYKTIPANPGVFKVYINGDLAFTKNSANGTGVDVTANHTSSRIGSFNVTNTGIECDIDDWMNADLPGNCDPITLDFIDENFSIDWLLGSHIKAHYTIAASQTNWTPVGAGVGVFNQRIPTSLTGTSQVVSTTSGAILEGITDALPLDIPDSTGIIVGAVGAIISLFSSNSGGTDGQLGYKVAGGASVLITINQSAILGINKVAYLPTGMIEPDEISPWSVVHTKSVDANTDTTLMMLSVVEYIGIWGPEDNALFNPDFIRLNNNHNYLYPNTAWGTVGSAPEAPVAAIGGTYIGNGTYQEIVLPATCHFLWIRPVTGGQSNGGVKFFGGAYSANVGVSLGMYRQLRVYFDILTGEFKFSVTGVNGDSNAVGIVYQYIAFCDPGMRFNLCGSFGHGGSAVGVNPLIVSNFLPEAGFLTTGVIGIPGSQGVFLRGSANSANTITPLTTAPLITDGCNFGLGVLNTFSFFHNTQSNSYSLWRTQDSAGLCTNVAVQILTYTGDGVNPRNIDLTPISGRFPLFILVSPGSVSGNSFFRDPSHVGANSSSCGLGASVAAITAVAIDQITINTDINQNGVVYNVFALVGDVLGMNNGIFFQDYCVNNGPYVPPEEPVPSIIGQGGLVLDGTTPLTLLRDISGIYTLIPNKTNDTYADKPAVGDAVDVDLKIPDPTWKTGYIGG